MAASPPAIGIDHVTTVPTNYEPSEDDDLEDVSSGRDDTDQ